MEPDKISELRQAIREAKSKKSAEKRSRCIRIYLTPQEEKQVLDSCQGIAASIYCRTKVLGQSVPRPRRQIPEINRSYYTELSKISGILSQIVRGIHQALSTGQTLPLSQEYLTQIHQTQEVLRTNYLELMRLANDYQTTLERDNYDANREGDL